MVIAVLLSWMYTRPIHTVVNAARMVAAGDLKVNLTSDRHDEIGELTQSFNFMVQKLNEKRALEEKLREAEHLSGIALLARGIAHEIRNPLNFISLSIDHLREKCVPSEHEKKEKFESLMTGIKQEIQRLNKLVGDFLDYGRPLQLAVHEVSINTLIEEIVTLIVARAEKESIVILRQYGQVPVLLLDPELIKTCIFNIILNAFEAMPCGGRLSIETRVSEDRVLIIIEDNGIGVPCDKVPKLFEPFFTTKTTGLGLGLAITKRVIEEHGGKVDFQSIEEKGSTVIMSLPVK
jgi:nitrogen fixation/metabolism regulation signal transduction histidine kinase